MTTNQEREWIDADKLREVIEGWRTTTNQTMHRVDKTYKSAAADLEALLPAPKPRTLADMTPEELGACQWMQATFTKSRREHIITQVFGGKARLLRRADGASFEVHHDEVIPLPDLPRMVWPDEHYLTTDEDVSITPPEIDTSTGHDDHMDMTQEAVAEVVRLCRELEELRDHNAYEADLHDDDDQFPEVVTLGKHNASQLTRILGRIHE